MSDARNTKARIGLQNLLHDPLQALGLSASRTALKYEILAAGNKLCDPIYRIQFL